MKHYGNFLPSAGSPVKHKVNDIDRLLLRKAQLESDLRLLENQLSEEEKAFAEYIKDEWSEEEIAEAKTKALI